MHSMWHIAEIQLFVLEHLDGRDLACVAQTCRTLFHPATDILWRKIGSYVPLLKCLPRHYRYDPLKTEDLHRFDMYAFKIRELHVVYSRPF